MEWLIVILLVVGVVVLLNVRAERKKSRVQAERARLYNDSINHHRQALVALPSSHSMPPLNPVLHGYRPVAKENLIAVQDGASRYELKNSGRYRTAYSSISIPIVKGIRYRVGSGRVSVEKAWQETARGRLLVTDKAIVFESPQKNERMTWGQIASIELMLDGYRIAKRSGAPRSFVVDVPDPKFAALLERMLSQGI
jgi:hypothetical protein